MKRSESGPIEKPSREAVAEAAAWIARLHSSRRTPQVEAGFRGWLAADEEHARAFEGMSEIWEQVPAAATGAIPRVRAWNASRRMMHPWASAAALVAACLLLSLGALWLRDPSYTTGVGEQRMVSLRDGTRVLMNANTHVTEKYNDAERRLVLEEGEAIFEVARHAEWPLVVIAGDRQIRALGTTFVVRRDERALSVTLIEGKIAVSRVPDLPGARARPDGQAELHFDSEGEMRGSSGRREHAPLQTRRGDDTESFTLSRGERLTFAGASLPKLDMPSVDVVTAWRRGEVVLDDTTLADAAAEMNRYDNSEIVIDDATISTLPVSGIYRTGDSAGFAQIVARMYGLTVIHEDGRIHLHEPADRSPH